MITVIIIGRIVPSKLHPLRSPIKHAELGHMTSPFCSFGHVTLHFDGNCKKLLQQCCDRNIVGDELIEKCTYKCKLNLKGRHCGQ
eukprot:4510571-Amphidinium_carterae.1